MATILGIESTCDETAAAVVREGYDVRSNAVASQVELHAKYRGVVPEIASRAQIENILPVVREALETAGPTTGTLLNLPMLGNVGTLAPTVRGSETASKRSRGIMMAAFDELDWSRFDVWAAVAMEGVAVVESAHRDACHAWLRRHGYAWTSIDFAQGVGPAVVALGERLRWEEQFGYTLTAEKRNLNALRDGFDFGLKPGEGHVLELINADIAYHEDPNWLGGLLAIAHEHSRWQLALGGRFFAMLILDRGSPLIGTAYQTLSVPVPFWTPARHGDPFAAVPPTNSRPVDE